MKLLLKSQRTKLVANHRARMKAFRAEMANPDVEIDHDPMPVVKLFNPSGAGTWLLTELNPETNVAFGLCDLGFGSPELGYVSLDSLTGIRGPFGLGIERDMYWSAEHPISEYARRADAAQGIVT